MAFEKITLDINANGEMPTFHCKQFDIGRPIIIDLVAGEDDYTPAAGVTFELQCRKVDMNLVVISDYEIDSNEITFASTEQLTACVGDNLATLKMFKDELEIGTMNFFINVAIDPEAQGIVSDTVIDNLTTQIEEITEQVIGDNYYDKEEVDDLLDLKADAADVYTKTETDTLLSAKADKSDTYTKAQVDSALSAKANTADLATVATTGDYDDLTNKPTIPAAQVQSDYAQSDDTKVDYIKNKPDINGMIATYIDNLLPTKSSSGTVANFTTALSLPLKSCTVDNSATNIIACGMNLFKGFTLPIHRGYWSADAYNGDDEVISIDTVAAWSNIRFHIPENVKITLSGFQAASGVYSAFLGSDDPDDIISTFLNWQTNSTLTVPEGAHFIGICWNYLNANFQDYLNAIAAVGESTQAYEAYNGNTYPVSDKDNIVTLRGTNNIFTDYGDVTVQYKDTTL